MYVPIPGALITYTSSLGGSYTTYANSFGIFFIPCPYSSIETFAVRVRTENADVVVRTGLPFAPSSTEVGAYTETTTTCTQFRSVAATNNDQSRVFDLMVRTIAASRLLLGRSRGGINVYIHAAENNSVYQRDADRIVIHPQHIAGELGAFTSAHEYGHAAHERALGGNTGSGTCDPHFLNGHHDYPCAFSEGFADYHAVATLGSETGFFATQIESNGYYPGGDGGDVEGSVAAYLYDLTDPANESHDATEYPGSYVADMFTTCYWELYPSVFIRAAGADHLTYCFERNVDPAVLNSAVYFPNRPDPSGYRESATEPGNWSRSNVRRVWKKNLYNENPPPGGLPLSGVVITGPSSVRPSATCTWIASPQNGTSPYSYWWDADGVFQSFDGPEVSYANAGTSFTLQVRVTDTVGDMVSSLLAVTVTSGASPCLL